MVQWFYQGQGHLQFLHNFFLIHVVGLLLLVTAIPERVTGGVQGPALGPRWGSRGRCPRENLGFYAILGVGELGFRDDFLKQKSQNHRII